MGEATLFRASPGRQLRIVTCLAALMLLVNALAAPQRGDKIEPFTLSTQDGKPFQWHPGRVTVLNFCAGWCDTWKQQVPRVESSERAVRGLPIDFLTISVDGRWAERISGAQLVSDPGGSWSGRIGIDRVPYTLVLDAQGIVRWSRSGIIRSSDLTTEIRAATKPRVMSGPVYLTFDDFPAKQGGNELLDLLRAQGVKATFFVVCSRAESESKLLRRAVDEGHRLQVHSWSHDALDPELDRCRRTLEELTGQTPTVYRPPGSESLETLTGAPLNMPVCDPYDYKRPGVNELVRRVLSDVKAGSVIQLHVGVRDTIEALPRLIGSMRKLGLHFEVLR